MASEWMDSVAQDADGWYYRITKSYGALTTKQKEANALLFYNYFKSKMTLAAIAGILGNVERESQMNPGQVEGDSQYNVGWTDLQRGHGFIQWTSANNPDTNPLVSWKDGATNSKWAQGNFQCYRILCEGEGTEGAGGTFFPSVNYPEYDYTWAEFCKLTDYEEATKAYLHERERAGVAALEDRLEYAKKWYEYLSKNAFKARLDDSDTSVLTNKYWISSLNGRGGLNYNTAIEDWPNAQSGWTEQDQKNIKGTGTTLPNCTSWAWGRAYEIMGEAPLRFSGDAGNWWNNYTKEELEAKGYTKSQTPSLGAIACWQDPDDPKSMGHVAIIEEVYDDGSISFSESGYTTWVWRPSYFNVQKNVKPTAVYTKYVFKGYIGLPGYAAATEPPTIESFKFKSAAAEEASFTISIKDEGGSLSGSYYSLGGKKVSNLSLKAGNNTFTIKKLVPNTKYSITVTLEAGTETVVSSAVEFTTKQDYPDPIKDITIVSTGKNLETVNFTVNIEEPARWGYWKTTAKNDYGYRVFIVEDSKLLSNSDSEVKKAMIIKPASKGVLHGNNFQVGISTWVTDDNNKKVFAEPGKDYPVCSNSVILKDVSEISDICYSLINDEIHKVQIYMKDSSSKSFKPTNIFKL